MALSDYEKQVLEEMEAQFDHQPSSFRDHVREDADVPRSSSKLSPKRVAAGSLMIVAGLLILVAAVSLGYSVISLIVGVSFHAWRRVVRLADSAGCALGREEDFFYAASRRALGSPICR